MVAQGAKGIVLCELDAASVNPAIDDAVKAGVKVVRLSDIVNPRGTVTLTFTNEAMGQAVGDFTGDLVNKQMNGQATVAILDYPKVPVLIQRADAMEKALLVTALVIRIMLRLDGSRSRYRTLRRRRLNRIASGDLRRLHHSLTCGGDILPGFPCRHGWRGLPADDHIL